MTKDQAIKQGYAEQVAAVDKVSCDFSARSEWPGKIPGEIEFTAFYTWTAVDDYEYTIVAYYYQDESDMPEDGDLGSLDWTPVNYEVI